VGDYSYEHSTKLPKHITEHHAWGVKSTERPDFMISPFQAQFQVWMAKTIGARRILEIGVYIGFSTMGWAEAVGPDGHVTGLEFSPEYAKISEESFAKNGIKNIDIIVGDAKES
jgi:predicted O-methyltransferase YrrM